MKCPKCGYVSYDYLDACRKCSVDLVEFKKTLRLDAVRPGDLDLRVVLAERTEQMGGAGAFDMDDDFFSAQTMLVEREEPVDEAEEEFDINLDDDGSETTTRRASFPPGTALHTTATDDVISFAEADDEEEDAALRTLSAEPSLPAAAPVAPVDMIDMSDLEDLDGMDIDLEEVPDHTAAVVSGEDTVIMQNFALPIADEPSESDAADITFSLAEADDDEAATASGTDDPREADLELQLEAEEEQWSAEPEADLQIDLDAFDLSDDDEEDRPKQS